MDDDCARRCGALAVRVDSLEKLIDERRDAAALTLAASERAIQRADDALEKRLDSMNEFRNAMMDQQKLMVSRIEWEAKHQSLIDKVDSTFRGLSRRDDTSTAERQELSMHIRDIEARAAARKDNISHAGVFFLAGSAVLSLLVSIAAFLANLQYRH